MHHDFTDQKQDSKTVEEDVHTLLNSIEDTRKNGKLRKKEKKRKKKQSLTPINWFHCHHKVQYRPSKHSLAPKPWN